MPIKIQGIQHGTIAEAGKMVGATQARIRDWARRGWVRHHEVARTMLVNLNDVKRRARIRGRDKQHKASYNRSIWLRLKTETLLALSEQASRMGLSQSEYMRLVLQRTVSSRGKALDRAYRKGFAAGKAACIRVIEEA